MIQLPSSAEEKWRVQATGFHWALERRPGDRDQILPIRRTEGSSFPISYRARSR